MTTAVLVTRQADNHYIARALVLSDIVASGASEAEAITALQATLQSAKCQAEGQRAR